MKILLLALILFAPVIAPAQKSEKKSDEERITIEDLKRKMDRREKVLIIDARAGSSWVGSSVRIKDALHITLDQIDSRMNDLPKDREIVIYCT